MKLWRIAIASLLVVVFLGFALLWFLPARWAMPLLQGRLGGMQLQDVSGLVWNGRAGRVLSAKGENLGALQWQLSRFALIGDNRLHVELHGPRVDFAGSMSGRQATDALWTDVQMRIDLDVLGAGPQVLGGWPRGTLRARAGSIELRGGWPWSMDARVQWQAATLRLPRQGDLFLGDVGADLHAVNGVIDGRLRDEGNGPLHLDGRLQLSPLARRLNAVAAPRGNDPALRRWLATFGNVDADGVTHINYSGGLAAAIPGEKR